MIPYPVNENVFNVLYKIFQNQITTTLASLKLDVSKRSMHKNKSQLGFSLKVMALFINFRHFLHRPFFENRQNFHQLFFA